MENFDDISNELKKELKIIRMENVIIFLLLLLLIFFILIFVWNPKINIILKVITTILLLLGILKLWVNSYKENDALERFLIKFLKINYKEEQIESVQELHEVEKEILLYKNNNGQQMRILHSGEDFGCKIKINYKDKKIYVFSQNDIRHTAINQGSNNVDKTYIAITNINTNKNLYLESIGRDYITKNKYIKYNRFECMFYDKKEKIKKFYEGPTKGNNEKEYIDLTDEDKEFFIKIHNKYNLLFDIILKDGKLIIVSRGRKKSLLDSTEYKIKYINELGDFLIKTIKEIDIYFSKKHDLNIITNDILSDEQI